MNRKMTQDQHDTIIAIKNDTFDIFWKERCGNETFQSKENNLSVISNLATETFDKVDWNHFRTKLLRSFDYSMTSKGIKFKKTKRVSTKQLLDCYVSTFICMRMIFPD